MTKRIDFEAEGGGAASGELALPAGTGPAPAVVVVQEWWGVNDHVRSLVDRLAAAGFLALAPDLYGGKVTRDPGEARQLMTALDGKQAMAIICGAAASLLAHPRALTQAPAREGAATGKVGIIGFCMGGAYALAAAALPVIGAAVPFYGIPPEDRLVYAKMKAPILGHYAGRDTHVKASRALEIAAEVNRHGGSAKIEVYDADHAFMNDTRPEVYAPEAAKLAWDRSVKFLHQHLG
jgi:carboxymethylenebutenolidase